MIKDLLVSFRDNFNEKTRNPFLGTYLFVWFVRNWDLVYTLFNFDNEQKLKDKVDYINNYYAQNDFLNNVWTNVYWSFGILVLTYILLNISRFIVNLSEKQLTPWIYKITDSNSIVLKSVYEATRTERDELQTRLDQERESKSRLEVRIKNLEAEIIELTTPKTETKSSGTSNRSEKTNKPINNDITILLQKLKEKGMLKEFIDSSIMINKGEYINNDYKPKDYFIELGLIKFKSDHWQGASKNYTLTADGESVLKKARLE